MKTLLRMKFQRIWNGMGELFSSTDKVDMTGWTEYPVSYHLDYRSEMVWQVRKSVKNFIKSGDFDNLADVFRVVWFYVFTVKRGE
ncbi:hypothetical protein [Streptococcus orisratti]|uniref:hypothetical protein n=1 Tax=Streptococcus orisratti TaxID=114652 RepID=UPI003D0079CE